jgi:hypothetical protein
MVPTSFPREEYSLTATMVDLPPLIELDDSLEAIQDFFETQGWTDGLPFVPPTVERVRAMYQYIDRDPGDVIARLPTRNADATVERIAINAVMAGCRPEYMPVVITAVQAMADPAFNLTVVQATTHPCAALVFVNGPVGRELNINSGHNCFGQGWRANASIGRAVRLILLNIGGSRPGERDLATHGTPAKYTYCAAENEEANPWQPLHVEHGYAPEDSTITVMAAEAPHNIHDSESETAIGLLMTMAGSLRSAGSNHMSTVGGQPLLVVAPEHAAIIARDGFSKDDVKRYIWEHARLPSADWSPDWQKSAIYLDRLQRFTGQQDVAMIAWDPSKIEVAVAGGNGKHSCWISTVGHPEYTATVMRRIERADGSPIRSVYGG